MFQVHIAIFLDTIVSIVILSPCPYQKKDAIEGKSILQNPNVTDGDELDEYFYKGSATYFDRLGSQVAIQKKTNASHCN